jgi:hypothetical protein
MKLKLITFFAVLVFVAGIVSLEHAHDDKTEKANICAPGTPERCH